MQDKQTKFNLFFDGGNFRVFSVPCYWPYCPIEEYAGYLRETDYVFLFDWSAWTSQEHQIKISNALNGRAIFLSSSREAHEARCALGLNSHIVSNNIFINENRFFYDNEEQNKIYRAVYTARAAAVKRIGLAKKVSDLALVVDRSFKSDVVKIDNSWTSVPCRYLNQGSLGPISLRRLYSQAYCGLALSTREGACLTVTEYLLCGLPVVSTKAEHPMGLGG